ncbi:MAG: ATP-binding cassette domain-containing protein [Oscillospiraceae bacterium]|nr:ATP-binding cassette domain-containing protein [Oscillospiraceae bacterium]
MISIRGIELRFGERVLFRSGNIDLTVGAYPLIGLNGTGKTTFLRMLAGFHKPASGSFSVNGDIMFQPQKPAVFGMSVLGNAMLGMNIRDRDSTLEVLSDVGLAEFAHAPARTLSVGEQQRLCLCRSILTGGDVFLFDEPFSAIDLNSADILADYLKSKCSHALTILAVHSLKTARRMSEKCLLIRQGELILCDIDAAAAHFIRSIE